MKKTLPIFGIATLITALMLTITSCQSKQKPDDLTLAAVDTAGLAQFQSWKVANEAKEAAAQYVQGYKDAMATAATQPVKVVHATRPAVRTAPASTSTTASKKKGWSKAAKGTVIGTAAGATAGALILKKNRVLGGVIGGVLGGGIGYGIGRGMDKKDGRVQ